MRKKQPNPSKEQLAQQAKAISDAQRSKKVVREVLFPILQKYAKTINHADRITEIFKVAVVANMQRPFKDKTVGDIDFSEDMVNEKDNESKQLLADLLEGFKDVPISDAMRILEGFTNGIQGYFQNEARKRPFSELTITDLIGE